MRMMINDVRPSGVQWIVKQSRCPKLCPNKIVNVANSLR